MTERVKMTVTMEVTPAQGLALKAMFDHWNKLASWGSSRQIAFYVDGDGNFKPRAQVSFSEPLPDLTDEMRKRSVVQEYGEGNLLFDYDPIAWILSK